MYCLVLYAKFVRSLFEHSATVSVHSPAHCRDVNYLTLAPRLLDYMPILAQQYQHFVKLRLREAGRFDERGLRNFAAVGIDGLARPFAMVGDETPQPQQGTQPSITEPGEHGADARVVGRVAIELKPFHRCRASPRARFDQYYCERYIAPGQDRCS